jgi:hypothetical protein
MYDADSCLDEAPPQGSPSGYAIDAAQMDGTLPLPAEHVALICDPSEFTSVAVPLPAVHMELAVCPVRLPQVYLSQYSRRREMCADMQDDLRRTWADLGYDTPTRERAGLEAAAGDVIADRFMKWMVASGKAQSLMDLIVLDKAT